ncbi:MAG TPA: tRNA (adenosine(37)-N6)-threonylcarbamoyltransferase complex ATPase subunit type 1 TsaE [Planctomycetota bacterium]|mgnify:CR=1 FL=1|nr:tRNA (adenosine(37)-N6)-threonylcarbamoyltransferase complex ATPase subunit type 1 TsaE [Planctomycetota bacterium]
MSELEDHRFLRRLLGDDDPNSLSVPGDDCAAIEVAGTLLVTSDAVVEGRHYEAASASVEDVARKLVHRNFSDLAAMGAWPTHVVATLVFRRGAWGEDLRHRFYRALATAVQARGARWVGGDLAVVDGPAVFSLTAFGTARVGRPIRRSGLRVGDRLFVSGPLGGSLASGRHLRFEPRLDFGERLAGHHEVAAMIDVSDGFLLDLGRLLDASRDGAGGAVLGAVVDIAALPLHDDTAGVEDRVEAALTDGEDYELLFAVRPEAAAAVLADPALLGARSVGVVDAGPGIRLRHTTGHLIERRPTGYVHDFGAGSDALFGTTFVTESEEATRDLGRRLGALLEPGDGIVLEGELGAGKTVFVRGLAEGLGVDDPSEVRSPTYLLMIEHEGDKPLLHVDAYFAGRSRDFLADGGEAYLREGFVVAIEWAERLEAAVPAAFHRVRIRHVGELQREITILRAPAPAEPLNRL